MRQIVVFLSVTLGILTTRCNQSVDSRLGGQKKVLDPIEIPPIPPPPKALSLIQSDTIRFLYAGEEIEFSASLSAFRLVDKNGLKLQTFSVVARNNKTIDSFYFAMPENLNPFWNSLVLRRGMGSFDIGFNDDDNRFKRLYEIYLGDANLNRNRIFMRFVLDGAK